MRSLASVAGSYSKVELQA